MEDRRGTTLKWGTPSIRLHFINTMVRLRKIKLTGKDMIDDTIGKYVNEASLSRIWKHLEAGRPFGMITAFRGDYTKRDNLARNKQMESAIRSAGFGFFRMDGHYVENYEKEDAQDVHEQSFFVIGNVGDESTFKVFLKSLGAKYNQDSVFYFDPATEKGYLVGTNSGGWPGKNKEISVGKWNPNKAGEFYSGMKGGRTFVFEAVQTPPNILSLVNDETLRNRWWTHLSEGVSIDRNANFKSALLKPITDLFDQMSGEDDDKKWTRLNNKAKKEFQRARISGMDFHGFHDMYVSSKKQ